MTHPGSDAARPWLSVIMPLHNGERWLEATLASVDEAEGIEFLCIDSSAGEETAAIAESFAGRLDLQLIKRGDLVGWPAKMNLAVELARADHICMLHQDDVWLPGRAAQVRRWIEANPKAALHLAPTAIIDSSGKRIGRWSCPLQAGPAARDDLLAKLLVQNFVSVPAPVFRRDSWLACGGMDPHLWYTADWDIWLKLSASGQVVYQREVTTGFRIHGNSLTVTGSAKREEFKEQLASVVERHIGLVPGQNRDAILRRAMASNQINCALADAMAGKVAAVPGAVLSLLKLGPVEFARYVRDSRIIDRIIPRLRARLAGAF